MAAESANIANQAVAGNPDEIRSRREVQRAAINLANRQAERTGLQRGDILGGVRKGIALTGNFKQFEKLQDFIADVADASASDFEDVGEASGNILLELNKTLKGDDAIKEFKTIMLGLSGQASAASIEFADMATEVGKITSAAGNFKGKASDLILTVNAMANLSKAGGAASVSEATTALMRIPSDIVKHQKQLKALGVKTTVDGGTKLKDPLEILIDTLVKSKGKLSPLSKIFGERSAKAVQPLQQAFVNASGGKTDKESLEAGATAARELVEKLKETAQTEEQNKEAAAFRREQSDRRLQKAINRLTIAFGEKILPVIESDFLPVLENDVVPALKEMAPQVKEAAQALAQFINFMRDNPIEGIGALILAKVAADLVGAGIGAGIKSALVSLIGNSGGTGPIGAAITVGSIAAGTLIYSGKSSGDRVFQGTHKANELLEEEKKIDPRYDEGQEKLKKLRTKTLEALNTENSTSLTTMDKFWGGVSSVFGGDSAEVSKEKGRQDLSLVLESLDKKIRDDSDRQAHSTRESVAAFSAWKLTASTMEKAGQAIIDANGGGSKRNEAPGQTRK